MGAGALNAFGGLEFSQLYAKPNFLNSTPPRRVAGTSGVITVPIAGTNVFTVDALLGDPIEAEQDGIAIDYMLAFVTVADTSGNLVLTDLLMELQRASDGAVGFVIPGAFPTLLTPRNATAINMVPPAIISGSDIMQFSRLGTGFGFINLPAAMRIRLIAAVHNNDGAATHNITMQLFVRWRKLTGLSEG